MKRFSKVKDRWLEQARQADYDTEVGDRASIQVRVATKKQWGRFSKTERFPPPLQRDEALHADYEPWAARDRVTPHGDPYRHTISVLRSKTPRFDPKKTIHEAETAHLGPGYASVDLNVTHQRPFSATVGDGKRFVDFEEEFVRATGGIHAQYDTDTGPKMSLGKRATSPGGHTYRSAFSAGERFEPPGHKDRHMRDTMANVEYEPRGPAYETLAQRAARPSNEFKSAFDPNRPRFRNDDGDTYLREALRYVDYDTTSGPYAGMADRIRSEKEKMAGVPWTQQGPRFKRPQTAPTMGPGYYDTTRAETVTRPNRPVPVIGNCPRFVYKTAPPSSEPKWQMYENDDKKWTERGAVISKVPRPDFVKKDVVDSVLNLDQGPKMSLSTSVARSPRRVSQMRSKQPRLADQLGAEGKEHLGPGYVDPKLLPSGRKFDIGDPEPARPSSGFASHSERFSEVPRGFDPHVWEHRKNVDYDTSEYRTIGEFVRTTRQGSGWAERGGRQ